MTITTRTVSRVREFRANTRELIDMIDQLVISIPSTNRDGDTLARAHDKFHDAQACFTEVIDRHTNRGEIDHDPVR